MNSMKILLAVMTIIIILSFTDAWGFGTCPLPSKMYSCSPKCHQDYDCSRGKLCCPNNCNSKSCAEPSSGASAGGRYGGYDNPKYSQTGGPGVYCNNVKCNSFEVCKPDPYTRRLRCQRP